MQKCIFIVFIWLIVCGWAAPTLDVFEGTTQNQITFDDVSTGTLASLGDSSITVNHTGDASATLAVVVIAARDNYDFTASATYGGSAMTQDVNVLNDGGSDYVRLMFFSLASPSSGSQNAVVSFGTATMKAASMAVMTLIGTATTSYVDATAIGTDNDTSFSLDITTTTDYAWIISAAMVDVQGATFTPGSGQTERADVSGSVGAIALGVSTEEKASAGVETCTWTATSNNYGAIVNVSYKPAP